MDGLSEEDVERLGSRLALVVSEDGEAGNAGRAMGQLARRLGLTGGQLKQIFLAGAAVPRADAGRLERELAALRKGLQDSESRLQAAERERDALQRDVAGLRHRLRRTRHAARSRLALTGVLVVVVVVATVVSLLVPLGSLSSPASAPLSLPADPPQADAGAELRRMAVVHAGHALVFQQPDRVAPVLATLPAGMPIVVRRVLWNSGLQWAEVEMGSGIGYMSIADIDLS